jgi:hypothetical protein
MTAYFDSRHEEINKLAANDINTAGVQGAYDLMRRLVELESAIVWDVTIAAEMPGFPEDLRDQVHRVVLKYGTETLPVNMPPGTGAQYDEFPDHCRGLNSMVWDLHTIFHEVAKLQLGGFSDDPRCPLRIIYSRGDERREQMVAAPDSPGVSSPE